MQKVRGLRLAVAAVAAACLAGTAASSAAAANTISVGNATLLGDVVAQVPGTLTCGPLDAFSVNGSVTIQQARNKAIGHGQAFFFTRPAIGQVGTPSPIVCDGTPQHVTVPVSADDSGPPFKNGTAVVTADVQVADPTTFQLVDSATTGPTEIRLH
jgi:hypothetical protein